MSDANKVAIVGIVATALVGLGGIAGSWVIAGEERHSQEKLAEAARVYDKRATTYIEALHLMSAVRKRATDMYSQPTGRSFQNVFRPFVQQDQDLDTRMFVWSSHSAYRLWEKLTVGLVSFEHHGSRRDLDEFRQNLKDLENAVQHELK